MPPERWDLRDSMNDLPSAIADRPCHGAWPARPRFASAGGDVFDRLTIRGRKSARIRDAQAQAQAEIERERDEVEALVGDPMRFLPELKHLVVERGTVNASSWEIEDDIRAGERAGRFDARVIAPARSVYRESDRHAGLKRRISRLLGGARIEETSYGRDPVA